MEIFICGLLVLPLFCAIVAFLIWVINFIGENGHNRRIETLDAESRANSFTPDQNGNYTARYFPEIGRVIHPLPGNQPPANVPYSLHYAPNNSNSYSGKPLNLGDNREQRLIAINRWQSGPEAGAEKMLESGNENQSTEQPEDTEPTPQEAAIALLQEGNSIREVMAATGLTNHAVRTLKQQLNSINPE